MKRKKKATKVLKTKQKREAAQILIAIKTATSSFVNDTDDQKLTQQKLIRRNGLDT